jgi:hypothetical protein
MQLSVRTAFVVGLFLLALVSVVHSPDLIISAWAQTTKPKASTAKQKAPPLKIHYGTEDLPGPVRELRETLLTAVQSGLIEELRQAYDIADVRPDLGGATPAGDPIAYWKKVSGDGEGREVLAILSLILDAGYVVLPLGKDLENNKLYIWPYFAEIPLGGITPAQEVELLRLVPPATARDMKQKGQYTHWRLAIGADGSWHSFRKAD